MPACIWTGGWPGSPRWWWAGPTARRPPSGRTCSTWCSTRAGWCPPPFFARTCCPSWPESSGCIRLEKPLDLAVLLLEDPARWNLETLQTELTKGQTRTVHVTRRVPVWVLYFTAEADGDGAVRFRPDLYGRDEAVLAQLNRVERNGAGVAGR